MEEIAKHLGCQSKKNLIYEVNGFEDLFALLSGGIGEGKDGEDLLKRLEDILGR